MQTKTLLSVAMMAVLLVAGHVYGQQTNPYAAAMSAPAGGSPPVFMGADGQAYMMVPDGSPIGTGYDSSAVQLASHLGGCGCGDKGCTSQGCTGKSCAVGCADKPCGGCGVCSTCCTGGWCHRVAVFGDYMYLRPRNAEVPFAVRINGPIVQPGIPRVQTSAVANLDPDYDAGFRAGFAFTLDNCTEVRATYSMFETDVTGSVSAATTADPNDVVFSLVEHPTTTSANINGLQINGAQSIDFKLVDVDLRRLFSYSCNHQYAWLVGVRYGQLEQNFQSQQFLNNTNTVITDIEMDGVGLRLGFDGERSILDNQLFGYLKTNANFVASEFRATYAQGTNFDASVVDTGYTAGRIVTMLDLEIGGGWQSQCGNWRLSAGYMFNGWFNVIKTDEWINRVQANEYENLGSTLTFDGLVARVEGRF